MAEQKVIPTTTITSIIGNDINIRTYYEEGEIVINTILAFISELEQIIGGINFIEGELGIVMINNPTDIDYQLDNNGNLIVTAYDASNYSIDENGELIYTY